jgi:hypothetical protein
VLHYHYIQKNINFGGQIVGETSTRALSISNKSNFALVYNITKSGSISSSFLNVLNGRRGIVAAMSTKVIEFEFRPKLPGLFEETLTIENLLNGGDSHVVVIKANVSKCDLFSLLPDNISDITDRIDDNLAGEFVVPIAELVISLMDRQNLENSPQSVPLPHFNLGIVLPSFLVTKSFKVRLQNPSSKQRQVVLTFQSAVFHGIVEEDSFVRCHFTVAKRESSARADGDGPNSLTADEKRRLLDKLETYNQKLKIAKRKGKPEKEQKYMSKIDEIKAKLETSGILKSDETNAQVVDPGDISVINASSIPSFPGKGDCTPFTLDPEEVVTVRVDVEMFLVTSTTELRAKCCVGALRVFEGKNEDDVKFVFFGAGIIDSSPIIIVDSATEDISASIGYKIGECSDVADLSNTISINSSEETLPLADHQFSQQVNLTIETSMFCLEIGKKYPAIKATVKSSLSLGIEFKRTVADGNSLHCDILVSSLSRAEAEFRVCWLNEKMILDSDPDVDEHNHCDELTANVVVGNGHVIQVPFPSAHFHTVSAPLAVWKVRVTWTPPPSNVKMRHIARFLNLIFRDSSDGGNEDSKYLAVVCSDSDIASIGVKKHVSFGDVIYGKNQHYQIIISNVGSAVLSYVAIINASNLGVCNQLEIIRNQTGDIRPGHSIAVDLSFTPTKVGKFETLMLVRNINCESDFVNVLLTCNVTFSQSRFVLYPDLVSDDMGKFNKLNLGLLQTPLLQHATSDAEFKFVLRLVNVYNEELLVSAVSNLKKQCFVYSDEECTIPAHMHRLQPYKMSALHILLRPSNLSQDDAELGRELRGGIRLVFYQGLNRCSSLDLPQEFKSDVKLYDSSIVFNAILGRSKFRINMLSRCFQALPIVTSSNVGVIRGSFEIENISQVFPIKYAVHSVCEEGSSGNIDPGEKMEKNTFRFEIVDGRDGEVRSQCHQFVQYALYFREISGLALISISVLNLYTQDIQTLDLSYFFDSTVLRSHVLQYESSVCKAELANTIRKDSMQSDLLYSRNVYVERFSPVRLWSPLWIQPSDAFLADDKASIPACESWFGDCVTCGPDRKLLQWELLNPRDKLVRVSPISNIPIKVSYEILSSHSSEGHNSATSVTSTGIKKSRTRSFTASDQQRTMISIPSELAHHGFTICGDPITISPFQSIKLHIFSASGEKVDIARNPLDGAIAFLSAAQTLESFFNPDPIKQSSKLSLSKECSVHPVLSYLAVRCPMVIPTLKVLHNDIQLGIIRHYSSVSVVVEVECRCDDDIPFRIENIPSWMMFSSSDGVVVDSKSNSSGGRVSSGTPVLVAGARKVTRIQFVLSVSKTWSSGMFSHTMRLKNLALSVPNSSAARDYININVTFDYDATLALIAKDSRGIQCSLRESSHNQMLALDPVGVPRSKTSDNEVRTIFSLQNTTDVILSVMPTLIVSSALGNMMSITLSHTTDCIEMRDEGVLLPGETMELSVTARSNDVSRVDLTVLERLVRAELEECGPHTRLDNGTRSSSDDESESNELTFSPLDHIDSLLLGCVSIAYSPEQSVDVRNTQSSYDEHGRIIVDIIGAVIPLPTTVITNSTVSEVQVIVIEIDIDRDRDPMFQARLPKHGDTQSPYKLCNIMNTQSTFKSKSSVIKSIKHESESSDYFTVLLEKEDFAVSLCPKNGGVLPSCDESPFELSLSICAVDSEDKWLSQFSELRDIFSSQFVLGSQDIDESEAVAEAFVAVYDDMTHPIHAPRVCRVLIRLAQSQDVTTCSREDVADSSDLPEAEGIYDKYSLGLMPVLRVRGVSPCASSGLLHEINMGQQVSQTEDVEWTMSLENMSRVQHLKYRISTLSKNDAKWLDVMQSIGIINREGMSSVVLNFRRSRLGIFSTYLLIENLSNLYDVCIVRVTMEVVQDWMKLKNECGEDGSRASYCNRHFVVNTPVQYIASEVSMRLYSRYKEIAAVKSGPASASSESSSTMTYHISSGDSEPFIDFGDVFVGHMYTRRSFSVENISDIPLDFHLSSTFPSSDLSFSLTPVSPRSVSRISVLPGENRIVFLIFKPSRHDDMKRTAFSSENMQIHGMVFVSCKLVKNHHETLQIYAHAFDANIDVAVVPSLADQDSRFKNLLQMNLRDSPPSSDRAQTTMDYKWYTNGVLYVKNMSCSEDDNLMITMYSCMVCFGLDICHVSNDQCYKISPWSWEVNDGNGTALDICLRPGEEVHVTLFFVDAILHKYDQRRDRQRDSGDSYFIGAEDHFMIYNRRNPAERCRVPVRLLIPREERHFPNSRDAATISQSPEVPVSFAALEGIIASFLKDFTGYWGEVIDHDSSTLSQRLRPVVDVGALTENPWADESHQKSSSDWTSSSSHDVTSALDKFFSGLQSVINITHSGVVPLNEDRVDASPERVKLISLAHRFANIFLHFHAITDMLVLHTMRQSSHGHEIMTSARTGVPVARLALLLYSVVFRHPIFQSHAQRLSELRNVDAKRSQTVLPIALLPFCRLPIYYSSFFYETSGECQLLMELREFALSLVGACHHA